MRRILILAFLLLTVSTAGAEVVVQCSENGRSYMVVMSAAANRPRTSCVVGSQSVFGSGRVIMDAVCYSSEIRIPSDCDTVTVNALEVSASNRWLYALCGILAGGLFGKAVIDAFLS